MFSVKTICTNCHYEFLCRKNKKFGEEPSQMPVASGRDNPATPLCPA